MRYFTQEDLKPSEKTLNIIRQMAYTCRVLSKGGRATMYYFN